LHRFLTGECYSKAGLLNGDVFLYKVEQDANKALLSSASYRAVPLPIHQLSDNEVIGYELLSRGPVGPLQMPDDFFKASIDADVLEDVDLACFKSCMKAAASYELSATLHVNLFPSTILSLSDEELLALFPKKKRTGAFCIEIVEHQRISDIMRIKRKMDKLRKKGIKLAIDDVGFGASSLESLIVLEPEVIKIDRRYVTDAYKDAERSRLLERLVRVAEVLGAELVAEGVCSQQDRKLLQKTGVELGQGPLWGKLL
jgi:EAL domain-containing protein (putative c-di-GMP-specific phosphodiesterase class I)